MAKETTKFPGFSICMKMMQKSDPQIMEDGFYSLLPYAGDYTQELIEAFNKEAQDYGLKCWLLELVAETDDPQALSFLQSHLNSDQESFRFWARKGLEQLNTKEARKILWEQNERDK